ncbi:hypothetical protein [Micromonospora sp. WMMD1082]|uniref:hypothetical protein n=1 Tax=Micromonospora sp. WMMD1082 TaxID=3016104 RepID=UPI0024169F2B|nr:hypothetical protein [Micromonospora sp. WMMD1082]MDG4796211.1 hypothetical protein [Micromonospora sp. WMMD1082]
MAEVFYVGADELATVSNTFTVDGTPTDPTTVTLVVTDPTGAATTYEVGDLTKTGTGAYRKDVPCTAPGVWTYVWVGTGTASDVTAGTWTVQSTGLHRLYCTPEELKSRVSINDTMSDLEILGSVTAVSRWIEDHCERTFYRQTATRTYDATGPLRVAVHDLVEVTALATDDGSGSYATTWAPSDFQLLRSAMVLRPEESPYTAIKAVAGRSFPSCTSGREQRIQVAGVFGWPMVPEPVRQAAAIWATDLLKLGTMAFGIAGYGEYGAVRARPNPIVEALLSAYQRMPVKVA